MKYYEALVGRHRHEVLHELMKTTALEKTLVDLFLYCDGLGAKYASECTHLYFCGSDNRKVIEFYMSKEPLSCLEQEEIENFYQNWNTGAVVNVPHISGQVKATESEFSLTKDKIKALGKVNGVNYRIQNAREDHENI